MSAALKQLQEDVAVLRRVSRIPDSGGVYAKSLLKLKSGIIWCWRWLTLLLSGSHIGLTKPVCSVLLLSAFSPSLPLLTSSFFLTLLPYLALSPSLNSSSSSLPPFTPPSSLSLLSLSESLP